MNARELLDELEERMARDDDRSVEEFRDRHPDSVLAIDVLRSALKLADADMFAGRAGYEVAWDLGNLIGKALR